MTDSMTFRVSEKQSLCNLCSANPAVVDFDITSDPDNSRQQGACCETCARNLLDALLRMKL
jgi:protein-arginine kinase activator protein McsA